MVEEIRADPFVPNDVNLGGEQPGKVLAAELRLAEFLLVSRKYYPMEYWQDPFGAMPYIRYNPGHVTHRDTDEERKKQNM